MKKKIRNLIVRVDTSDEARIRKLRRHHGCTASVLVRDLLVQEEIRVDSKAKQ